MTMQIGPAIVDVLEGAARRYLNPEGYDAFVFHLGCGSGLCRYDCSEAYWERVQAMLDGFFTSAERAAICEILIADAERRHRPEFHGFLARALAERRIQGLAQSAMLQQGAGHPKWGKHVA